MSNKKTNKSKSYMFVIIALILISVAAFFLIQPSSGLISKDPATIALSQADVSNLPPGLVFNSTMSEQRYKLGNYWFNDSQLQAALNQGFMNGYYDNFFYQDSAASNIEIIGSSISTYNQSAQEILKGDIQAYLPQYNCISFNLPTIGDKSFGCYMVLNISNIEMSYYEVFFYKNNVVVRTWVGQTGLVDSSAEAVQYADIIANKV